MEAVRDRDKKGLMFRSLANIFCQNKLTDRISRLNVFKRQHFSNISTMEFVKNWGLVGNLVDLLL